MLTEKDVQPTGRKAMMSLPVQTPPAKVEPAGVEWDLLAAVLARRFIRRWDLYSRQREDGRYICIRKRLHHDHLLEHLKGEITLGAYVLDEESRGTYLVFDADDDPDWRRLQALGTVLLEEDTTAYLERSRRGGHLWLFFETPLTGREIRRFGEGLMRHFRLGDMELFPKQAELDGGPGSLIRLPFGVHRKSGRRYGFYLADGQPLAPTLRQQIHLLDQPQTVPAEVIARFSLDNTSQKVHDSIPLPSNMQEESDEDPPLYERIKQAVSVREFVSQYVDLTPKGTGLCPFHDDTVESFSVHAEKNYWKCFAGCGSGSIIDFWMKWRNIELGEAIAELQSLLQVA